MHVRAGKVRVPGYSAILTTGVDVIGNCGFATRFQA